MANSNIVSSLKNEVIDAMIEDEMFFKMIDPNIGNDGKFGHVVESPDDLRDTHIFRFNRNPETITDVETFITVTVDLNYRDRAKFFVTPVLTIWVYSHNEHMVLTKEEREEFFTYINEETNKISRTSHYYDSRNDFLSIMIDEKFNNKLTGFGRLRLVSNTEGQAGQTFLYRRLIFDTIDLSDSVCDTFD